MIASEMLREAGNDDVTVVAPPAPRMTLSFDSGERTIVRPPSKLPRSDAGRYSVVAARGDA